MQEHKLRSHRVFRLKLHRTWIQVRELANSHNRLLIFCWLSIAHSIKQVMTWNPVRNHPSHPSRWDPCLWCRWMGRTFWRLLPSFGREEPGRCSKFRNSFHKFVNHDCNAAECWWCPMRRFLAMPCLAVSICRSRLGTFSFTHRQNAYYSDGFHFDWCEMKETVHSFNWFPSLICFQVNLTNLMISHWGY